MAAPSAIGMMIGFLLLLIAAARAGKTAVVAGGRRCPSASWCRSSPLWCLP